MKFLIGAIVFVATWAIVGSGMEAAGIEMPQIYMAFGAIWGMLWIGWLEVCSR